jgi:hypothetical protein
MRVERLPSKITELIIKNCFQDRIFSLNETPNIENRGKTFTELLTLDPIWLPGHSCRIRLSSYLHKTSHLNLAYWSNRHPKTGGLGPACNGVSIGNSNVHKNTHLRAV